MVVGSQVIRDINSHPISSRIIYDSRLKIDTLD